MKKAARNLQSPSSATSMSGEKLLVIVAVLIYFEPFLKGLDNSETIIETVLLLSLIMATSCKLNNSDV